MPKRPLTGYPPARGDGLAAAGRLVKLIAICSAPMIAAALSAAALWWWL